MTEITSETAPHWANGCEKCRYGLVEAPHALSNYNLWEQRMAQAKHRLLEFCDCKAGVAYRNHLRKQYKFTMTEQLYTMPVLDTSTKQPILNDDGKPMTGLELMEYRVVMDSVEAPRKRFWQTGDSRNDIAQLGFGDTESGGEVEAQGEGHTPAYSRA